MRVGKVPVVKSDVDSIDLIQIFPNSNNTALDKNKPIIFTKEGGDSAWVLPAKSYLYIKGRLVKEDGTPYVKDAVEDYPDIALVNNALMFLFSSAKYKLDHEEIENFNSPGYVTLMNALLTKSDNFTGLEQVWAMDSFDASTKEYVLYYPFDEFEDADLPFPD